MKKIVFTFHDRTVQEYFAINCFMQMYSCGSLAPKMGRGGGCMDHKFCKPSEPWELADGYVVAVVCPVTTYSLLASVRLVPAILEATVLSLYVFSCYILVLGWSMYKFGNIPSG